MRYAQRMELLGRRRLLRRIGSLAITAAAAVQSLPERVAEHYREVEAGTGLGPERTWFLSDGTFRQWYASAEWTGRWVWLNGERATITLTKLRDLMTAPK
jgi:hypothetical protein